jgi:hypothetical protein
VTVRTKVLDLDYLPSIHEDTVHTVCESWKGTPYKLNGKYKGKGVDCLHFAAGVLDELYGTTHSSNLISLPPDACVHNREGIEVATRALFRAYPVVRVVNGTIEAGDLLVTSISPDKRSPSHLRVASKRGMLWEAVHPTVMLSGFCIFDTETVVAVFRATNKYLWSHASLR